jgi:GT2 family glycosyltransferase
MISVIIAPDDLQPGIEWFHRLRALMPESATYYTPEQDRSSVNAKVAEFVRSDHSYVEQSMSALRTESRLLVVPSLMPSIVPIICSALMRGTPVVGFNSPLAERVIGNAGVLLDRSVAPVVLLDAIQKLLDDSEHYAGIAAQGPKHIEQLLKMGLAESRTTKPSPLSAAPVTSSSDKQDASHGVTVIIPTRGGARVARCLRALRSAAGDLPLQVVFVVTGGLTGSLPPCDDVVRCEPPFVWARANNAGLRVARYPFVLFLNDDCYFARAGDLHRLLRRLQLCGHLIAVAPIGTGFPADWEQSVLPRRVGLRETRYALCGACFLMRREAIWSVGEFDERFVTYGCDEIDWFYRARHCGYHWAIETNVSVEHEGSATFGMLGAPDYQPGIALFRHLHGVEPADGRHWDSPTADISWVIASRNNAGHLARCLGSIAAVRRVYPPNAEVVLALDGCTDLSADVARGFNDSLESPLRLRIVQFAEPAGSAAKAKNRAIRLASGEFHLLMDDDDATTEGRALLLSAVDDDTDVVVGNFWSIHMNGTVTLRSPGTVSFRHLLDFESQNWGPWATIIPRRTWVRYGLHDESLEGNEDLALWLRWMRDGARFRHIDVPTHLYLLRSGSEVFSRNTIANARNVRTAYRTGRGGPRMGMQTAHAPVTLPSVPRRRKTA